MARTAPSPVTSAEVEGSGWVTWAEGGVLRPCAGPGWCWQHGVVAPSDRFDRVGPTGRAVLATGHTDVPAAPVPSPAPALPAAVAETHISVLFFVGDRAYKLKKPVDFGFLDFSTRAKRQVACHREVELNRRLAPDVYLGVADVTGPDGEPADHLVVMRRMPEDRRLSALVADAAPDVERRVGEVARLVGAFHAGLDHSAATDAAGTVAAVLGHWEDDVTAMAPFVGPVLDREAFDRVIERARTYLAGRGPLLDRRVADGHVVDGHGDLQAGDVFCLDDGPRILDCLEFSDELRRGDVLADIGFLAMDLERLGRPDLAEHAVTAWAAAAGHHGTDVPRSLLHHEIAYRAHVRSKVACLRYAQEPPDDPARAESAAAARDLLALADRHLDAARVRLVLVGGAPGTGKSTLARRLGHARDWPVLRSDEVRKALAHLAPTDRSGAGAVGEGIYGPEWTARTYAALLERAEHHLVLGESVVLDASWTDAAHRRDAWRLAESVHAEVVELRCTLAPAVAAERIRARQATGADASDADEEVAAALAAAAAPWPEAIEVDTSSSPDEVLAAALPLVGPA